MDVNNRIKYISNMGEFAQALGLEGSNNPRYKSIHKRPKLSTKDMKCLYKEKIPAKNYWKTTGLLPRLYTLNYLLRLTLDPNVDDTTNIRGHPWKLMANLIRLLHSISWNTYVSA